ncbi:phytanoyl-CoA dioxygenase family protein [Candidatus Pelagibacter sp. Uisw_127]|uniref:phytanoyl-CoA dioxygenase family protein n=1 Tax=Candidatus Pelagibacter sp. Uisw_127 TaxID=3230988 RepID=UPI0039E891C5|tara:strand:- start:2407 stop:3228 length:822 start_codon:yes stop_codon:yes gene_type:complete
MKRFFYKEKDLPSTYNYFKKEGFITFKNISKKNDVEDIFKSLFYLYNKYSKKKLKKYNKKKLNENLIKLRKNNKSAFSSIYDDAQICHSTYKILHSEKVLEIGRILLGEKKNSPIGVSGTMLRLDPPHDNRNLYNWHQDHSYYHQNKSGTNGLVISIGLNNIDINNGALKVATRSHKSGYIDAKTIRKDFSSAQQYSISPKKIISYKTSLQTLKQCDLSAIYLDTMHASGDNLSNELRVTGLVRLHKIMSKDFRSYRDNTAFIDEIKKKIILY